MTRTLINTRTERFHCARIATTGRPGVVEYLRTALCGYRGGEFAPRFTFAPLVCAKCVRLSVLTPKATP